MPDEKPAQDTAGTISLAQCEALLLCTGRHVQQLVKDGFIPKPDKRGRYSIVAAVHGRITSIQAEKKNETKTAAENRVKDARAREIEMRNARTDKAVVDIDEALAIIDEILGDVRAGFTGLPARMTRDLAERNKLEAEIDDILNRAASSLVKKGATVRAGGAAVEVEPETDG